MKKRCCNWIECGSWGVSKYEYETEAGTNEK